MARRRGAAMRRDCPCSRYFEINSHGLETGDFSHHSPLEVVSHAFVQNLYTDAQYELGELSLGKCLAGFAERGNLIHDDAICHWSHRFRRCAGHAVKKLQRNGGPFGGDPGKLNAVRLTQRDRRRWSSILDGDLAAVCFRVPWAGPRRRGFHPEKSAIGGDS